MSTVCYCGQPDCPVTTWEHDACDAKPYTMDDVHAWVEMRWERERLDEKVMARIRATVEERDALKAQVEAARKVCVSKHRGNGATLDEWNMAVDILHAMKAAK